MRKFTFIFFTATILCINFACSINKSISIKTIKRIKSTTVPIVCGTKKRDGEFHVNKIIGSAFFINDEGYFLTAGHVFNDWAKIDTTKEKCFPAIYMVMGGWEADTTQIRWFRFKTCRRNEVTDIAICKPKTNPFLTEDVKRQINFVTFTKLQSLEDGTPVAFTGFPLNFIRPITAKGNIASYIETEKRIVIDNSAWPGASGSPVYRHDAQVVGIIIQRGINKGTGLAYARDTDSIIKFLTINKIKFHQKKQN